MLKLQSVVLWLTSIFSLWAFFTYAPVFAIEESPTAPQNQKQQQYQQQTFTSSGDDNGASIEKNNNKTVGIQKGKLIFSHVIYRHGDRMPIGPYPTDPWKSRKEWPANWGELTKLGKDQHYHLGQWLRKRYNTILNRTYSNDEIYVCSTDVDRTLMSALSNLAGLYPPVDNDIWNANIKWQPIPVHTIPEKLDPVLAGKMRCPAYDYAFAALLDSPEFQKYNQQYQYLFDYLTKYTGQEVSSFEAIQRLNNTFFIESLYNKTLPDWAAKVYPSPQMSYIAAFTFAINTYTTQMARLKIGPLIKEIFNRFQAKVEGQLQPDRSVWVYSAHDTTIGNVLNGLRMFDIHSPPYIACILMELRLDERNVPFVSIYYKNTTGEPYLMNIPNCGTSCPLKKMFTIYNDILPKDWETECKLSTFMMTYEEADVGMAMGILIAIISVMLFLSYVIMIYHRRCSYKPYYSYTQVA